MYANIEIVFLDFLKNDSLDLCDLWFGPRAQPEVGAKGAEAPSPLSQVKVKKEDNKF